MFLSLLVASILAYFAWASKSKEEREAARVARAERETKPLVEFKSLTSRLPDRPWGAPRLQKEVVLHGAIGLGAIGAVLALVAFFAHALTPVALMGVTLSLVLGVYLREREWRLRAVESEFALVLSDGDLFVPEDWS